VTGLGRILAVFTTPARELLALTEQQHPTPKPGYCMASITYINTKRPARGRDARAHTHRESRCR
jgi:hypothetical protein